MASMPPLRQRRFLHPPLTLLTSRTGVRCYATAQIPVAPTSQSWPHQPQFGNINDDRVAQLAAKPLHPLSLADLVRYWVPDRVIRTFLLTTADRLCVLDMAARPSLLKTFFPPPTSRCHSFPFALLTASKLFAISLSLSSPTRTYLESTTTMFTPCPLFSLTKRDALRTLRMRYSSPRSWPT